MGVFGGKYCAVNGLSTVARWTLSEVTNTKHFRASNLKGGTGRRRGIYDYSGTIEGYGSVPPVMPGEYFTFVGYTAPSNGQLGYTGKCKSVANAIVENVSIQWNWNTGEILKWTINFAAGEPLRVSETTSAVEDTSNPTIFEVCGTSLKIGPDSQNMVVWPNLVSAQLNIKAENPTFVNSSTNCSTGRRPGPIDWDLSITEESSGVLSTYEPGYQARLQLFVDDTDSWLLEFGHYVDRSNLKVDAETGEIVSQQHNFAMNIVDDTDDTTLGVIGRPGEDGGSGSEYWFPDLVADDTLPF